MVAGVPDEDGVRRGDTPSHRPSGGGVAEPADGRIRILMLAACPADTPQLALDVEAREISDQLRLAQDRDAFQLITCWAVRPPDLLRNLNQHRPYIVHFSGHGSASGEIVLSTGGRGQHRVSSEALGELFRTMKDNIRVIVLNACYTTVQAQAIGRHIDYIIGMRTPVDDQAAIVFAAAFYSALGFRRTVREAFDQAVTALMIHGMPDHATPELVTRPGADPYLTVTTGTTDPPAPVRGPGATVSMNATVSGSGRVYQAGRDQYINEQ